MIIDSFSQEELNILIFALLCYADHNEKEIQDVYKIDDVCSKIMKIKLDNEGVLM